jgi:hypothetical protein
MSTIVTIITCVALAALLTGALLRRAARRRAASWSRVSSLPTYSSRPAFARELRTAEEQPDDEQLVLVESDAELRDRIAAALWAGNVAEAKKLGRAARRNEGGRR